MDEFEEVECGLLSSSDLFRLRVPGGWLYRLRQWRDYVDDHGHDQQELVGMTTTFVPST